MHRKISILLVLFLGFAIVFFPLTFARGKGESVEEKLEDVEQVLKEIRSTPDLVSPDSIHTATAIKALYYQNIQIIELLGEIRDLLKQSLEKDQGKE